LGEEGLGPGGGRHVRVRIDEARNHPAPRRSTTFACGSNRTPARSPT
jgi:hypothetical protein